MNKKIMIATVMTLILVVGCLTGCMGKTSGEEGKTKTESGKEFAEFTGEDLDGNKIDQSMLKNNKVTVLNFWFNDCSACVAEMPELEKLNAELKEKGAELIGVNADASVTKSGAKEAKKILSEQGATYKNIALTGNDKAKQYLESIDAFPTTLLVDENGNIIGEPIVGSINNKESMDRILKAVDEVSE